MKRFFKQKEAALITPLPPIVSYPHDNPVANAQGSSYPRYHPQPPSSPSSSSPDSTHRQLRSDHTWSPPPPPAALEYPNLQRPTFDHHKSSSWDRSTNHQPPIIDRNLATSDNTWRDPSFTLNELVPRSKKPCPPDTRQPPFSHSPNQNLHQFQTIERLSLELSSQPPPPTTTTTRSDAGLMGGIKRWSSTKGKDRDHDLASKPMSDNQSSAYPVYANPGSEHSETLISTSIDVLGEPQSSNNKDRDKEKGKRRLFGFGHKDDKNRKDQTIPPQLDASLPYSAINPLQQHQPTIPFQQQQPARFNPSLDLARNPSLQKEKEPAWYDVRAKLNPQQQVKEPEGVITSRIGWICANAYTEQDWSYVIPLMESVSQSESDSKEAARALRKEFKYGTVETQKRAVRLWALLATYASDRFKLQIASKKFLEAVQDVLSSSKTPLSVKETMLRVLAALAYEYRNDSELGTVTKFWNKVKPSDCARDGEPRQSYMVEFQLPSPPSPPQPPHPSRPDSHGQPFALDPATMSTDHSALAMNPNSDSRFLHHSAQQQPSRHLSRPPIHDGTHSSHPSDPLRDRSAFPSNPGHHPLPFMHHDSFQLPSDSDSQRPPPFLPTMAPRATTTHTPLYLGDIIPPDQDVRQLHEECQIARSNADVLIETVLTEGLRPETNELIHEFYDKVVKSQEFIMSQISWASSQADRSRESLERQRTISVAEGRPFTADSAETAEEKLLADLVQSHGKLIEASSLVDETRRRIKEEEEERMITERSKVEVRLDRTALGKDSITGDLYERDHFDVTRLDPGNGVLSQASGSASPLLHSKVSPRSLSPEMSHLDSETAALPPPPNTAMFSSVHTFGSSTGHRTPRPLPVPGSDSHSVSSMGGGGGGGGGGSSVYANSVAAAAAISTGGNAVYANSVTAAVTGTGRIFTSVQRHSASRISLHQSMVSDSNRTDPSTHSREASGNPFGYQQQQQSFGSKNPYMLTIGNGALNHPSAISSATHNPFYPSSKVESSVTNPFSSSHKSHGHSNSNDSGKGIRISTSVEKTVTAAPIHALFTSEVVQQQQRYMPVSIDPTFQDRMTNPFLFTDHLYPQTDYRQQDHDSEDEIQTPIVPSEKALGKRRAVSDRQDAFISSSPTTTTT